MAERDVPSTGLAASGEHSDRGGDAATRELGLRERKKLETRRRISDIATGLFMTRGFDQVTVADVARTADVSVNTVFNYFRTKEDLFFDRDDEMTAQAANAFSERRPGETAAAAFRRSFMEGLDARSIHTGFHEGSETWAKTVQASPALVARQREIGQRAEDALAERIAEETGAGADDTAPRIAAAMIFAVYRGLVNDIVRRKIAGETLEEMSRSVHANARRAFDLLENGLGDYAASPADPAA